MALATKYKGNSKNSPYGAASTSTYGPTGKPSNATTQAQAQTNAVVNAVQNATSYATPTANVTSGTTTSKSSSNYNNYYTPTGNVSSAYQKMVSAQRADPGDYDESEYTEQYRNKLSDVENSKPDAFTSKYSEQIANLLDSIYNQESFSYNPTTDEGFQNYKSMYQNNARRAMQDTLGSAAQLTGGYGSTAAQTAAQQSYDQTMSGLNSAYLDFWDRAYQQYQDNRANQYNQLNAFNTQDNIDYSRYRDDVSDWQTDRSYYANQLANNQNYDLNVYNTDLARYQNNRDYYTNLYNTENANDQWAQEFALNRQAQDYQNMLTEQAIQQGGIETQMAQGQYDLYNYYRQMGYNYTQAMNLMNGLNADGTKIGSGSSGSGRGRSRKKNSSNDSDKTDDSKGIVSNEDFIRKYADLSNSNSGTAADKYSAEDFAQDVIKNNYIDFGKGLLTPITTAERNKYYAKQIKKS